MVYVTFLSLSVTDEEKREMEIELLSTDDVIIGDHITPPPITPPTELQLVRQVTVGGKCLTVCQYKGYTYVGLGRGGIDRIDDQGNVESSFIKGSSFVVSIGAYDDRLYTLFYGNPDRLCVCKEEKPTISGIDPSNLILFASNSFA